MRPPHPSPIKIQSSLLIVPAYLLYISVEHAKFLVFHCELHFGFYLQLRDFNNLHLSSVP